MGQGFLYYALRPSQLRSIIQWKVWHEPVHTRDPSKEDPTLRECFKYLDMTSRSFAAVIQELHPELLVPITLYYLVLRGLDTIEDDPTLPLVVKEPLLRSFHEHLEEDGWVFTESGPNEKDRELLVHFDVVIAEMRKIKKPYFDIIREITIKMENGMADFVVDNEKSETGIQTIKDYERYCHFAAGVVGEGLTRLFVESNLANPRLLKRPHLTESMGQFLQKTNVIRDVKEDWDDHRRWWPHEVWGKYFEKWDDIFEPANREKAMWCTSELVLNALGNAEDCLFYMAGVRDQSVFNFVAIPQSMAIATLDLIFRNPEMFERNVKITKGDACQLMLDSTQNLFTVCEVFRKYARRIHDKNDPRDPSYLAISVACARIEQFIETLYPRQNPKKLAAENLRKMNKEPTSDPGEMLVLVGVVVVSMILMATMMIGVAWVLGTHFSWLFEEPLITWDPLFTFGSGGDKTTATAAAAGTTAHQEL